MGSELVCVCGGYFIFVLNTAPHHHHHHRLPARSVPTDTPSPKPPNLPPRRAQHGKAETSQLSPPPHSAQSTLKLPLNDTFVALRRVFGHIHTHAHNEEPPPRTTLSWHKRSRDGLWEAFHVGGMFLSGPTEDPDRPPQAHPGLGRRCALGLGSSVAA